MLQQFCRNQLFWTADCFSTVFRYRSDKRKTYKSCAWYLSTFLQLAKKYDSCYFGPYNMFPQNIHFLDPCQNLDLNLTLPHRNIKTTSPTGAEVTYYFVYCYKCSSYHIIPNREHFQAEQPQWATWPVWPTWQHEQNDDMTNITNNNEHVQLDQKDLHIKNHYHDQHD